MKKRGGKMLGWVPWYTMHKLFQGLRDAWLLAEKLEARRLNELIDQSYAIPAALTQGKDHITIRFQAHRSNLAGGVFGLHLLKP